jgi:hypothetical protein
MFNFSSLFGGIGSFLGGQAEAKGYKAAEKGYEEAARITKVEGGLKDLAIRRQIFQTEGTANAQVGASGLQLGGSAMDVIRSNTQQGYLTKAVTALNTKLEYNNYMAQAEQAHAAAKASKTSGIMGAIGGVLGFFSDDRLKDNIVFRGRRGDGLGVYEFTFKGGTDRYEGVMADEVEVLYPSAVSIDNGYKRVDYIRINADFRRVA